MNGRRVARLPATSTAVSTAKELAVARREVRSRSAGSATWRRGASGEAGASRMGGHGLSDELEHPLAEYPAIERSRVRTQRIGIPGDRLCAPNCPDQAVDVLSLKEHPCAAIDDRVQGATGGVGNHRASAGVEIGR